MKNFDILINQFHEGIKPHSPTPLMPIEGKTLIFFDTETTGLNPFTSQITEIAAMAVEGSTNTTLDIFHRKIMLLQELKAKLSNDTVYENYYELNSKFKNIERNLDFLKKEIAEAKYNKMIVSGIVMSLQNTPAMQGLDIIKSIAKFVLIGEFNPLRIEFRGLRQKRKYLKINRGAKDLFLNMVYRNWLVPTTPPLPEIENKPKSGKLSLRDVLDKTQYSKEDADIEEVQAINEFREFVQKQKNPILIAHNASFDMKMVNTRAKNYNVPQINAPVYDTIAFARIFYIPLLQHLENGGDANAKTILDGLTQKITKKGKRYNISAVLSKMAAANNIEINPEDLQREYSQLVSRYNFDIDQTYHTAIYDVFILAKVFAVVNDYVDKNLTPEVQSSPSFMSISDPAYKRHLRMVNPAQHKKPKPKKKVEVPIIP